MDENLKNTNHSENAEYDEITKEKLTDHDYDGIKELDNDLPSWWRYLFYLCILFAIGYLMKYHVFKQGLLQNDEYLAEFPTEEVIDTIEEKIVEIILEPLTDPADIEAGNQIFSQNCKVCHKANGEGDVGPNLTDNYWIHGGTYKEIVTLIREGVPIKGMASWKTQISKQAIEQVATHVWNLHGTNPANQKEPQGVEYIRP